MGVIKSAAEIAAEKVGQIGAVTGEERLQWKYTPEGEKLAVKCLKDGCNLAAELGHFDEKARKYVAGGAADILVRNINLPKNEVIKKDTKKAMDALKGLKKDKVAVENVYSNLRRLFDHYGNQGEQQKKQAYQQLKSDFAARIQQAAQQQGQVIRGNIDVERQPQFREEWRKVLAQIDSQYTKLLDEYKHELLQIA